MRVDLAGFGVGRVWVGHLRGEMGVLQCKGRVAMVYQWNWGKAHERAVTALHLITGRINREIGLGSKVGSV